MKIDVTHDVKMALAASVCGCNDANEFMIKRDSLVYDLKLLQLSSLHNLDQNNGYCCQLVAFHIRCDV